MAYADNPKAYFDYNILETLEAGLVLSGQEVKSVKTGKATIRGSFVKIFGGPTYAKASAAKEAWLVGATISPYQPNNPSTSGASSEYDPQRTRKILLNKKEVKYLFEKSQEAGLTIVPLKLYGKNNLIKLEIGLARGKKKYDKREAIKKREEERKIRKITTA